MTPEQLNHWCADAFPGHLGIHFVESSRDQIIAEMQVQPHLLAPNGYLHAGSVVTLADTCCGSGCAANLPDKAAGFTTIELKSNHLGTCREGSVVCIAKPGHLGRTTQVWDATVTNQQSGKTIAVFRCTQMILYSSP